MKKIKEPLKQVEVTVKVIKKHKTLHSNMKGDVEVPIKVNEKFIKKPIVPETGTRFQSNSARQTSLEYVIKHAQEGKTISQIRDEFCFYNKENGCKFNLDSGYVFFVISCHPEFFKMYKNGIIDVIKFPAPDIEAYKQTNRYIDKIKRNIRINRERRKAQALLI
jgi:hypothetical protein